jgi:hypothetical protein
MADRMPMMAMTTSSSMSVKAECALPFMRMCLYLQERTY